MENLDNVTIQYPEKKLVSLIKWLVDNTNKEKYRPVLTYIKIAKVTDVDSNYLCWATNGFSLVRAEIYEPLLNVIQPCVYEVINCTSKLLHMVPQPDVTYPNVETVYDTDLVDPYTCTLANLDPRYLIPIIKPFEMVSIHSKGQSTISIALRLSDTLPSGRYVSILMAKGFQQGLDTFNDYFKPPALTLETSNEELLDDQT